MDLRLQYERAKEALLSDESICAANRELFRSFFEFETYKLKRRNSLPGLDNACCKTLYGYIHRLRNVNSWFNNKPWADLTRDDIKRVYDDLEDGRILNAKGTHFKDPQSYYNKVLKSKPFRLAGKAELAKDVIEFSRPRGEDVRFITEDAFRLLVEAVPDLRKKALLWLAWDIGENIDALLQLTRSDFTRQNNRHTGEPEYIVNLPQRKIKRSRQSRSEPTLYSETVRFLDIALRDLAPTAVVFSFGYRQAVKTLHQARKKTGATTMPNGDPVRWKDFRSGMACHLLRLGWTRDEVNARLGHTPQSSALNAYINYLAIDREKPKQKLAQAASEALQHELTQSKQQTALLAEQLRRQDESNRWLREELLSIREDLSRLNPRD
ncbi:MAG: hypothetical protein ACF8NJ_05940 [Phycisphaerales bacterium JB038]